MLCHYHTIIIKAKSQTIGKLVTCIDPLNHVSHPPGNLINIGNGRISPALVNVDDSVKLGEKLMRAYVEGGLKALTNHSKIQLLLCLPQEEM